MICSVSCTALPVRSNDRVTVYCKGTTMKTSTQIESISLLPAECLAITTCLGNLLTAIGSLLQEHPDLNTELSPDTGQFLIEIGQKLSKAR